MGRRLVREFELDAVKLNPDQVLPMPATQLLSELLIIQFLFQVGDPQVFVVWRWRGQAGAHRPDVGDRAQHALRNPGWQVMGCWHDGWASERLGLSYTDLSVRSKQ